jgi:hypothetical protein
MEKKVIKQAARDSLIGQYVRMSYAGKILHCTIRGRLNKFATIVPIGPGPCIEFSWSVVERAVNENRVLKGD